MLDAVAPRVARQRAQGRAELCSKACDTHAWGTLAHLYQHGCARIRLPRTINPALEAVLINTAGGLTGDDNLQWQVTAAADTHVRVSTSASEKLYRTHGPAAVQQTRLSVGENARLDWLPQETILFNNASLHRELEAELAGSARLLIGEAILLGRKAMGETPQRGELLDRWRVYRNGTLLHAESLKLTGDIGLAIQRQAVLHANSAFATLLYCGPETQEALTLLADRLWQNVQPSASDAALGVSVLPNRLVVRLVATDGFTLRRYLIPCINLLSNPLPLPRVWTV